MLLPPDCADYSCTCWDMLAQSPVCTYLLRRLTNMQSTRQETLVLAQVDDDWKPHRGNGRKQPGPCPCHLPHEDARIQRHPPALHLRSPRQGAPLADRRFSIAPWTFLSMAPSDDEALFPKGHNMVVSLQYLTACIAQRSSLCMQDRPGKQTFLCILQPSICTLSLHKTTLRLSFQSKPAACSGFSSLAC